MYGTTTAGYLDALRSVAQKGEGDTLAHYRLTENGDSWINRVRHMVREWLRMHDAVLKRREKHAMACLTEGMDHIIDELWGNITNSSWYCSNQEYLPTPPTGSPHRSERSEGSRNHSALIAFLQLPMTQRRAIAPMPRPPAAAPAAHDGAS